MSETGADPQDPSIDDLDTEVVEDLDVEGEGGDADEVGGGYGHAYTGGCRGH